VDVADFWDNSSPDWHEYIGPELTDELVLAAEQAVGYLLPASYRELLRVQNGGLPKRRCFPVGRRFVEITGLYGVGGWYGIDSPDRGSQYMIKEWEYPAVGIVIAPTPSAGHDTIMLDYSECGPTGEPRVIHVETECAPTRVRVLAPDFAAFVAGLVTCAE
jgi:hypothetical protein